MSKATDQISGQIAWVYTEDLATSVRFYRDALGLAVWRDAGSAMVFETGPASYLGVCQVFDERVVQPEGGMITLLSDDVDGVDAWYARLRAKGVEIAHPPERLKQFGIYSFFCTDPNGYVIEIQSFLT